MEMFAVEVFLWWAEDSYVVEGTREEVCAELGLSDEDWAEVLDDTFVDGVRGRSVMLYEE